MGKRLGKEGEETGWDSNDNYNNNSNNDDDKIIQKERSARSQAEGKNNKNMLHKNYFQ